MVKRVKCIMCKWVTTIDDYSKTDKCYCSVRIGIGHGNYGVYKLETPRHCEDFDYNEGWEYYLN